jgi:AcrR family transcriptional regulator
MTDNEADEPHSGERRYGAALEQAIFDAAWELLAEGDPAQVTMAAIAARAGTSKPVLYRRWPNRAELIMAAVHSKVPKPDLDDVSHGSLRADLVALLRSAVAWVGGLPPAVVDSLRTLTAADPELRDLFRARTSFVDVRPGMSLALQRAAERGETSGEPVSERVLRLPMDLLRLEAMNRGLMADPGKAIDEIVDEVMLPVLTARPKPVRDRRPR